MTDPTPEDVAKAMLSQAEVNMHLLAAIVTMAARIEALEVAAVALQARDATLQ